MKKIIIIIYGGVGFKRLNLIESLLKIANFTTLQLFGWFINGIPILYLKKAKFFFCKKSNCRRFC